MSKMIYLAGKMTGLSDEEMYTWRKDLQDRVEEVTEFAWNVFNPAENFNPNSTYCNYKYGDDLDRIAMNIDLDKLRHSRLVICDMEHQDSLGTAAELGIAHELNIPIIGVCPKEKLNTLHPWWLLMSTVIVDDYEDAFLFFIDNFVNND